MALTSDGSSLFSRAWAPLAHGTKPKSFAVCTWNTSALAARAEDSMKAKRNYLRKLAFSHDVICAQEVHGSTFNVACVLALFKNHWG